MRHALLLTGLALAFAVPAAAQNGSVAATLELYPTYQSVGVRLGFTGDANGNATARLEWRPAGGATWNPGVAMTRITGSRWAGSVLWLTTDRSYDVRAIIDDPDGGASATGTVNTRRELTTTPTGRTWWVATNGNDAGSGGSGSPLATLNAAAAIAQPGDEIRVRPGIYYQTLDTPRAGTAGSPIHLVADAPGVVIDGSDPAYLNRTDWRNDSGGIFSVPYSVTANRIVCVDSLQRLYKQASLAALQTNANAMTQGFAIEGSRLYVKLEDGSDPTGHVVHLARYNVGLYVDASYWRIDGFEVRYFGMTSNGSGIQLLGANGCRISNNHVHVIGGRGIFLRLGSADVLIEGNLVRDPRVGAWPWNSTKGHEEEITGISNRAGRGNVIRSNTVRGFFDGLDANVGDTDENIAADADYHDNLVVACGDDGIETDTVSGINLRLWRNRFDGCFSGISIAPIYQGPEYVLYNEITNTYRGSFKFSLSSTGHAYIYHNTTSQTHSGAPAVHPSGVYSNMHFANNILGAKGAATVSDDAGESATGNTFDYDLLTTDYAALFRWKNTNYSSLSSLRSATGFEMSGRSGDPMFVSSASGDYRLQSDSPAIDGALRLPGINDAFSGAAPDMGAWELGAIDAGPDAIRPAPITDLR
jgi:hypothetical protein